MYADYLIGYYMLLRKLCCFENKLAAVFESKFVQNVFHSQPRSFRPISGHLSGFFFSSNRSKVDKGSIQQGQHLFNSAILDYKVNTAADFECINLTVRFRYWSCSDARRNRKTPVAVLKELM